jgi:hypothetical protein
VGAQCGFGRYKGIGDALESASSGAKARGKKLGTLDPAGAVERMRVARKSQAAQFAANLDVQAGGRRKSLHKPVLGGGDRNHRIADLGRSGATIPERPKAPAPTDLQRTRLGLAISPKCQGAAFSLSDQDVRFTVRSIRAAASEISYHSVDGAKFKGPSMTIKFEGKPPFYLGIAEVA